MNNTATKCVPVSPDEYIHLTDEEIDAQLLSIATERMAHYDPNAAIPSFFVTTVRPLFPARYSSTAAILSSGLNLLRPIKILPIV